MTKLEQYIDELTAIKLILDDNDDNNCVPIYDRLYSVHIPKEYILKLPYDLALMYIQYTGFYQQSSEFQEIVYKLMQREDIDYKALCNFLKVDLLEYEEGMDAQVYTALFKALRTGERNHIKYIDALINEIRECLPFASEEERSFYRTIMYRLQKSIQIIQQNSKFQVTRNV